MDQQANQMSADSNDQDSERLTVEVPTEIEAGKPIIIIIEPVCTCPPGCCG